MDGVWTPVHLVYIYQMDTRKTYEFKEIGLIFTIFQDQMESCVPNLTDWFLFCYYFNWIKNYPLFTLLLVRGQYSLGRAIREVNFTIKG